MGAPVALAPYPHAMARRSGPNRSKKPTNRSGGKSGPSRFEKGGKSGAKPGFAPRSGTGKSRDKGAGKTRARFDSSAGDVPRGARPRQGIIEVRADSPDDEAFERVGEASIGDAPAQGGWDIANPREDDALNGDDGATADLDGVDSDASEELDDDGANDDGDAIQARQRVRLQRVLADAGVAARRHAEGLIEQGRVTVNGQVVRDLPCFVDPHFDRIHVDGRPIPKPARHVYVMFHKPERVLVTDADEPGMDRKTLRDFVRHPAAPRLFAIGRLDFQTTGLVLMTNDGELANRVSHPRANLAKTYHVVVKGAPTPQNMKVFTRAAAAGDRAKAKDDPRAAMKMRTRPRTPLEVRVITSDAAKSLLEVTTRDERNLDIRGACLAAGLPVKKITRINYGPVRLTALPLGNWRELTRPEVNALKKSARLAKEGRASPAPSNPGVDFSNIPAEKLGEPDADQPDTGVVRSPSRGESRPAIGKMAGKSGAARPTPPRPAGKSSARGDSGTGASRPAAQPQRPASRPSRNSEPAPSRFRPRVIS